MKKEQIEEKAKKFEVDTLLKLRRQYSKEEAVAALDKRLKEVEYENGLLKSEVSELEYYKKLNKKLTGDLKTSNNNMEQLRSGLERNGVLKNKVKELKIYIEHLETRLFAEETKK